ncbi:MAG: hypothetical protein KJ023_11485 [Burkholderiaceae bacterium]|nr:hypothetical protein [Burkholderiaceae bacterium]
MPIGWCEDMAQRGFMIERRCRAGDIIARKRLAVRTDRGEARRHADPFDLPVHEPSEFAIPRRGQSVNAELHARRTCVDRQDHVVHEV